MLIEDLIKEVDIDGRIIGAYVVYTDFSGKRHKKIVFNETEYKCLETMFNSQRKRTEELKKLTPKAEYTAKEYRYALPEYKEKNIHVGKALVSIVSGIVLGVGVAAGIEFAINRDNPNFTVLKRIQVGVGDTKEDRFITRNEEKFTECGRCIFSGDYSEAPEFDGEFIRDYVSSCYRANTDGIPYGITNDSRYQFDFKQFMSATDRIAYENSAASEMYKSIVRRWKNPDANELEAYTNYGVYVNKYLDQVLGFILQHLDPKDDEFTKLGRLTRIVIIEEAKSALTLASDDYTFFNHAFPTRNQNKEELIEALDKKEIAAVECLNTTIKQNKGITLTR